MTFEEDVELEMEVQKIQRISKHIDESFIICMGNITYNKMQVYKMDDGDGYMSPYEYGGPNYDEDIWAIKDMPFWYRKELILEEFYNGANAEEYDIYNTYNIRNLNEEEEKYYDYYEQIENLLEYSDTEEEFIKEIKKFNDEYNNVQPTAQSQPVVENNMRRLLTIKPFVL